MCTDVGGSNHQADELTVLALHQAVVVVLRVARDKRAAPLHAAMPTSPQASSPATMVLPGVIVTLADVVLRFNQGLQVLDVPSPQPDLPAGTQHRVHLLVKPARVEQHSVPHDVPPPRGAGLEEDHVPLGRRPGFHGDLVHGGSVLAAVLEKMDVTETGSAQWPGAGSGSGGSSCPRRGAAALEVPGLPAFGAGLERDDGLVPGSPLDLPQAAARFAQLLVLHGFAEFPLHSRLKRHQQSISYDKIQPICSLFSERVKKVSFFMSSQP